MSEVTISSEAKPDTLSNEDLLSTVDTLVRRESEATLRLLDHLVELERRKEVYLSLGYSSLFDFLHRKYCHPRSRPRTTPEGWYSEPSAWRRVQGARCMSEFPEVRELLAAREVTLTTITLFAGRLTRENYREILAKVRGKGKTEVRRVMDEFFPMKELRREIVRPIVIAPRQEVVSSTVPFDFNGGGISSLGAESSGLDGFRERENGNENLEVSSDSAPVKASPAEAPTMGERRMELRYTVSEATMDEIERARIIISRKTGKVVSLEEVMSKAVGEFVTRHDPVQRHERREARRLARTARREQAERETREKVERPREEQSETSPVRLSVGVSPATEARGDKHKIPLRVADAVFARDGMRCAHRGPDGTRCNNSVALELEHCYPHALGGEGSEENVMVVCSLHNLHRAEAIFGRDYMAQYRQRSRAHSTR